MKVKLQGTDHLHTAPREALLLHICKGERKCARIEFTDGVVEDCKEQLWDLHCLEEHHQYFNHFTIHHVAGLSQWCFVLPFMKHSSHLGLDQKVPPDVWLGEHLVKSRAGGTKGDHVLRLLLLEEDLLQDLCGQIQQPNHLGDVSSAKIGLTLNKISNVCSILII